MEYIFYNRATLKKAINSKEIFKTVDIPITLNRALSHTENPRLDNEDILLIIAKENDTLLGYIGILPDFIFVKNTKIKLGILTTWWAKTGSSVGLPLLIKALKSYDYKMFGAEYSKEAGLIYLGSKKFKNLNTKRQINIFFSNQNNNNNLIIRVIKNISNKFYAYGQKLWVLKNKNLLNQYIVKIDEELNDFDKKFIEKIDKNSLFRRNLKEFKWIIKHPWILNNEKSNKRYFFSSIAKIFRYKIIKIYNKENKTIEAIIILKQKNNTFNICYFFSNEEFEAKALKICLLEVLKLKPYYISIFDKKLIEIYEDSILSYFARSKIFERNIIISTPLFNDVFKENKIIHGGDADNIFT